MRRGILLVGFGIDGQKPNQIFANLVIVDDSYAPALTLTVARPADFAYTA